jgi:hypothetical protein
VTLLDGEAEVEIEGVVTELGRFDTTYIPGAASTHFAIAARSR